MNLLPKIILLSVSIVLVSVLLTGHFAAGNANAAVLDANIKYMQFVLKTFVNDAVITRHDLLVSSGLDRIDSFVDAYKNEALNNAASMLRPEMEHLIIIDGVTGAIYEIGADITEWSETDPPFEIVDERQGDKGYEHIQTERGPEIALRIQFKPWNWTIMLAQNDRVVHAIQLKITLMTLLIAMVSSVFAIGLMIVLLTRFFIRPVHALVAAAARISAHESIDAIEIRNNDELGKLGRSIEEMATSIDDYRAAQLKWQNELEAKVKERTEEIAQARRTLQHEIVDHKRTEKALRKSEDLIRLIADNVPSLISYVDDTLTYRFANKCYKRWFGLNEEELVGQKVQKVVGMATYERVAPHIKRALNGEVVSYETTLSSSNGSARNIFNNFVPHLSEEGAVLGYFALVSDVTEIKNSERLLLESEKKLIQAQKLESVGRLAGGVAHDFNNLLTTIIGYSELLIMEQDLDDATMAGIQEIRKSADRAAALTQQLLAFSRKQVLQPKVIDPNELILNAMKMIGRLTPADIKISTILYPDIGHVKADPSQIDQVLMNLAVNAGDAMPEGGTFTIKTENVYLDEGHQQHHPETVLGDFVEIEVSDTGHGMNEEIVEHIFDPFYTTKDIGKGTGLGLATVHGIVKQSDGYIWVSSKPDHGTTFKIYLPLVEAEGHQARTIEGKSYVGGDDTILLVEDEDTLRKMAKTVLVGLGYSVIESSNGIEALSNIEDGGYPRIDCLVTDMIMPEMGGAELSKQLLKQYPFLKVLLISGYTEESVSQGGVLDEAVSFLQKPFSPQSLAEKVREVLDEN
jgi:PAS domain S-box-containing protein